MNIITGIPPETHNQWIGIDTEWSDMNEKQLHRPTSGKFALMSIAIGDNVYILDQENQVTPALENIQDNWHIFHHAKFDITQIRRLYPYAPRKRVWDTMLMERILWGGYYDTFGLKDLVRRYLFTHMEKELQKSFIGTEISAEQVRYAASDAWVLPKIVEAQKRYTSKDDFHIWTEIDCPAMFAFMDFQGFAIDVEAWKTLAVKNKVRQEQIDKELPFNPRSNGAKGQVVLNLEKLGFKKIPDSKEETLLKWIAKYPDAEAVKYAEMILDSRMYGKRASTYGMNFIEDFLEYDNEVPVIVADYWVTGAETGRTSCSSPNMQNIPARETKDFRKCFVARPGNKLIIGDYSAQEVFVAAFASQDKKLIDICNSGIDVYVASAKLILDIDIDKKDPRRNEMKPLILGSNYGMSKYGVAKKLNCSVDEAEEIIVKRIKAFPQLEQYLQSQSRSRNKVKTVAGRTIHLNHYSGQAERNALNDPIQGGAADCMKKSLGHLHRVYCDYHNGLDVRFPVVGYFHDEMVLDVPEDDVEDTKEFTQRIMVDTANEMFKGLNFKADISVGGNWSEK